MSKEPKKPRATIEQRLIVYRKIMEWKNQMRRQDGGENENNNHNDSNSEADK